jgi:hypothetical protein
MPGRVILFDSRIEHEALPITYNAKTCRFSIALKCSNDTALEYLKKANGDDSVIEAVHAQ